MNKKYTKKQPEEAGNTNNYPSAATLGLKYQKGIEKDLITVTHNQAPPMIAQALVKSPLESISQR